MRVNKRNQWAYLTIGRSGPKTAMHHCIFMAKSLITWRVSVRAVTSLAHRAEILLDYTLNFSPCTKPKFRWENYWGAKTQSMRIIAFLLQPGWKNDSDNIDFSARLPVTKFSLGWNLLQDIVWWVTKFSCKRGTASVALFKNCWQGHEVTRMWRQTLVQFNFPSSRISGAMVFVWMMEAVWSKVEILSPHFLHSTFSTFLIFYTPRSAHSTEPRIDIFVSLL